MPLLCSKVFYRFDAENESCASEATQYVSTEPFFLGESYCAEHGAELVAWLLKRSIKAYVCYLPKIHAASSEHAEAETATNSDAVSDSPQPPQGDGSDEDATN